MVAVLVVAAWGGLLLAPAALADVIPAGTMAVAGSDSGSCSAVGSPGSPDVNAGTVRFKVTHSLTEVGTQEDRWEFYLDSVIWTDWPTDALGNGASPGDDTTGDSDIISDTPSHTDDQTGEVNSKTWGTDDFPVDGEYRAEVSFHVVYKSRPDWGEGTFSTKCEQSAQSTIVIGYTGPSGGLNDPPADIDGSGLP